MRNKQDWSLVDLEVLDEGAVPITSFKPAMSRDVYDASYDRWTERTGAPVSARKYYRVAWRNMARRDRERSLIPAIIPPGSAHVHGLSALGSVESGRDTVILAGLLSSLPYDFLVRVSQRSTISGGMVNRLPLPNSLLASEMILRVLRLNCLTNAYADLWALLYRDEFVRDSWANDVARKNRPKLGEVPPSWDHRVPLRVAADRYQAQVEIDAIVALALNLSIEELCAVYRTEFSILFKYDKSRYVYDANGRSVPGEVIAKWRAKGERISIEERTATNQAGYTYIYELPFRTHDREHDMRVAYAEFERRLKERS